MRRLLLLLACLVSACAEPTAPTCADRTIVTDTIGWVQKLDGTFAPITATGPRCIRLELR